MHNRDQIWTKSNGEEIKIKNMTSSHLINVLKLISNQSNNFFYIYGNKEIKKIKKVISQEIRYRKMNRINIESDSDKLF